jgi:hypothetical protein
MKPRLPAEIELRFPPSLLHEIYKFVPKNLSESKKSPPSYQSSPVFQKDMKKIQNSKLKGKSEMYLRDFEDFVLD